MSVIVTKSGFGADEFSGMFSDATPAQGAIEIVASDTPEELVERFDEVKIIRIVFNNFADGTGFSHAHHLRQLGFKGRLRACGPLIADQLSMALNAGFDEVEVPDDLAARQPEADWIAAFKRYENLSYQARLRQSA